MMTLRRAATMLALATPLMAAGPQPGAPAPRTGDAVPEIPAAMKARYTRPAAIPFPATNAFSPAKVALGHQLFFEPRLSRHSTMSCATCHNPALAWGDGLPTGRGVEGNRLGRRSPTILNMAWAEALMWDGRADSLEDQALGPVAAEAEMALPIPELIARLDRIPGYRTAFTQVFPAEGITGPSIAKAIAAFERTVLSNKAPFDRWIDGDEAAISPAAKRGFVAFNTSANCAACHSGWRFTDDSFHDIGLPGTDPGRGRIIAGVEPLQQAFKTPGLRNITQRGPFMHDGTMRSLTQVIQHYDTGFIQRSSLSQEVYRLNLSEQTVGDLVAFLKTLTSIDDPIPAPVLPEEVTE